MSARVSLTIQDVQSLASAAGLDLAADCGPIPEVTQELSGLVSNYVFSMRLSAQRHVRRGTEQWAQAVSRWAGEGTVLFGVETDDWTRRGSTAVSAAYHLSRGWPDLDKTESARLQAELHLIGLGEKDQDHGDFEIIVNLIERLGSTLCILIHLGQNATDDPINRGRPENFDQKELFINLGKFYERVHAPATFSVSGRGSNTVSIIERAWRPHGAALTWCQALFALCPRRVAGHVADSLPEITDLAKWAEQSDAVADRIRRTRQHLKLLATRKREK